MNDRQRFLAAMNYKPRDRAPVWDFGFWPETIVEWKKQGLPAWVNNGWGDDTTGRFFGMDRMAAVGDYGINPGLIPAFEEKVLEDRGDHELAQQSDGVIVLRKKYMGSIPEHHGHLLVDRASWLQHYRPRLEPDHPRRVPADLAAARNIWHDPECPGPRTVFCGSLYGWIRDWMGVENVSLAVYDDPAWFEEMVVTLADCAVSALNRVFAAGAAYDAAAFWEDMCYNGGPLLSPEHFKRFLVPQYQRITSILRAHGCGVVWVDCDGRIDQLIPLWLEAGVNTMFPIEVGTWGADPVRYRREYGRDLLLMGGVDKHVLAGNPRQIEREVVRLTALSDEGGFIGFPDHRVPPDVPLVNYLHYLRCVRRHWCRDVNLPAMGRIEKPAAPRRTAKAMQP